MFIARMTQKGIFTKILNSMKKMIYPKIHGSAYDNLLQKNNSEISIEINQTFDICDIFEDITSEVIYYIGYY